MTNSYYTSLTGMLAASFGLQNTSHNIANMQSPGFKRTDVFYSSLGGGQSQSGLGSGVRISGTTTNFNPGLNVATGKPSDLAIGGQGFFIVRQKNGELLYTKSGEFNFNAEGQLVDKHSGGLVLGYNEKGDLVLIQQFGPKIKQGKATSLIDLGGEFVLITKSDDEKEQDNISPEPFKSDFKNINFSLSSIFDAQGKAHTLDLEFKPKGIEKKKDPEKFSASLNLLDGLDWELESVSYDGTAIYFGSQSLEFSRTEGGAANALYSLIELDLPNEQKLTLNFGTHSSSEDSSVRLYPYSTSKTKSVLKISQQDGYQEGKQTSFFFDENGQISYNYDNKQVEEGIYVALAKFDDLENTLIQTTDNLFRSKNNYGRHIGRANKGGFGSIIPTKLETSNVDSTTEFGNIVVLQRMFQACSQIMEIDKQLLEELFKK